MKKVLLLIALLCNMITAAAFRIEYGNNIVISQPVLEDLYIAGGTITINARIYGDLIIAGGTIIINDTVTNDILLAGGNVTFNGFVGDDIRCAGGEIRIRKNVTGDIVIAGGTVIIDRGATIGGLLSSGGEVTIDGNVNGEITGAFGELILNGAVSKSIDCRGGKITLNGNVGGKSVIAAKDILIGPTASFNDDVRYWNTNGSLDFRQSQKSGKAMYDPSLRIRQGTWYFLGAASVLGLLWYLGMAFVMILMVQYLFRDTMKNAADTFFNSTLKSLVYGGLFFILVPILAVIAFITLVGIPVGLLLIAGYITLILLATVITSIVIANWFNNRFDKKWKYWSIVFSAFGIFVVLKLISLTPFAGWLVMILLVCISFGSILVNVHRNYNQVKPGVIQNG